MAVSFPPYPMETVHHSSEQDKLSHNAESITSRTFANAFRDCSFLQYQLPEEVAITVSKFVEDWLRSASPMVSFQWHVRRSLQVSALRGF